MELSRISLILIVLSISLRFALGQEQTKPILFEELRGENAFCSEFLANRSDYFALELDKYPNSKGYIIFYGNNSQEGKNLSYLQYFQQRNSAELLADKIKIIRGENKDEMTAQLWIVPSGSDAPTVNGNFVKAEINSTILFDRSWADWHKWNDSEWTIYSYSFVEWGCDIDLNMKAFAETLRSEQNLTGYLLVYTKFGKGKNQAKKVTDFAIKELTEQHKVAKGKLKTIYGGNRNEPELELWFVPRGKMPPMVKPEKIIKK